MKAEQKPSPVKVVGRTDDLRISAVRALIAPQLLLEELPMDAAANAYDSVSSAAQGTPFQHMYAVPPLWQAFTAS